MKNKIRISFTFLATVVASLIGFAEAQNVLVARDTIVDPYAVYPENHQADYHELRKSWYFNNYVALSRDYENYPAADMPEDDEIIARLQSIETDMELPFNASVKFYISKYCNDWRGAVENMLGLSLYYMPIFEKALLEEGVPVEFKYLPVIESSMQPTAKSRAKATGLWQFMYDTAKGMGITINTLVDERCDPEVSSRAAAKYLHTLHDMYDDWCLTLAAYNWGPGNVNKTLARYGGNGKPDYWAIRRYMPDETKNYVPKFIAVVYVMNFYDRHNISPALAKQPIIVDSVHVSKRVHFNQISEVLDIPVEVIRALNPQYVKDIIPGDSDHHYVLKLPSFQTLCYAMSEDSIVAHNAHLYARRDVVDDSTTQEVSSDGKWIVTTEVSYYKIKKGDTYAKIARKYGVSVNSLQKWNNNRKLIAGKSIRIEKQKRVAAPVEEAVSDNTMMEQPSEIEGFDNESNLESGAEDTIVETPTEETPDDAMENVFETQSVVVQTAEVPVPPSQESGKADESVIIIEEGEDEGDEFEQRVFAEEGTSIEDERTAHVAAEPSATTPKVQSKSDSPVYYKVVKGDNLGRIASRYRTTVAKLQQLNNLTGTNIQVGQRLRVK